MIQAIESINQRLFEIAVPLFALLLTLTFGYILRKILFRRLIHWSNKTKSKIDDIVIESIKEPFIIWFIMLGAYLGLEISKMPEEIVAIIGKILLSLGILSVTLGLANIATGIIKVYSGKIQTALPITSLTQSISRIIIFGIGILIILNSLGISITPILATLGIGGLAVALALQDTLSNLFSGFHVIISRQLQVGDYVKLDSGEEGYITDITWRTTKIRMLPNNVVLVPNEKLTKSIITNYCLPDKELAVLINLGVHYNSDLKEVERVTTEVAKGVMKEVVGGVEGFDPFIRFHTFGDSGIQFTVILRAKEFVDQYLIKHEFIKRLHERYAKEGIVVPYPIRAVNYKQEEDTHGPGQKASQP